MPRLRAVLTGAGARAALPPGIPIKSTLDQATTNQYAAAHSQLAAKARSVVRDIDPQNDLTFLRFRTKKHEVMVAPGTSRAAHRRSSPRPPLCSCRGSTRFYCSYTGNTYICLPL